MIVSFWTYVSGYPASVSGSCDEDIRQPADMDQGTGLTACRRDDWLAVTLGDVGRGEDLRSHAEQPQ